MKKMDETLYISVFTLSCILMCCFKFVLLSFLKIYEGTLSINAIVQHKTVAISAFRQVIN